VDAGEPWDFREMEMGEAGGVVWGVAMTSTWVVADAGGDLLRPDGEDDIFVFLSFQSLRQCFKFKHI